MSFKGNLWDPLSTSCRRLIKKHDLKQKLTDQLAGQGERQQQEWVLERVLAERGTVHGQPRKIKTKQPKNIRVILHPPKISSLLNQNQNKQTSMNIFPRQTGPRRKHDDDIQRNTLTND